MNLSRRNLIAGSASFAGLFAAIVAGATQVRPTDERTTAQAQTIAQADAVGATAGVNPNLATILAVF